MAQVKNTDSRRDLLHRLARVEGQLRGIMRLLENEADCYAVAQQMSAARRALDKAFFAMVSCMLEQEDISRDKIVEILVKLA